MRLESIVRSDIPGIVFAAIEPQSLRPKSGAYLIYEFWASLKKCVNILYNVYLMFL